MKYDLVVMAGGKLDPGEWGDGCPSTKALLKIGEKTLLETTLEAFQSVTSIDSRVVVGDDPEIGVIAHRFGARSIPTGDGLVGNIKNALVELKHSLSEYMILATSDIPLFNSDSAERLLAQFDRCAGQFDFVYPVVPVEKCYSVAPGMHRTSIKTRDGRFTGGNVFMLNKVRIKENIPFLESLMRLRKSPIRLAGVIGIDTLFSLITGLGTLDSFARKFERRITGKVLAMVCESPEVAIDIDSREDFAKMTSCDGAS